MTNNPCQGKTAGALRGAANSLHHRLNMMKLQAQEVATEPADTLAQKAALEGEGQALQLRPGSDELGALHVPEVIGHRGNNLSPIFLFSAHDFGQGSERGIESRVEFALQKRNQFCTHPVAAQAEILVGGIIAPGLAAGLQPASQRGAGDSQQRTHQGSGGGASSNGTRGQNPGQPRRAGAAQQAQQDGFRLVVAGMPGDDAIASSRGNQLVKKSVPMVARPLLSIGGRRQRSADAKMERRLHPQRQVGYPIGVGRGIGTPAVVVVDDSQLPAMGGSEFGKQKEQRSGIRATGYRDTNAVARVQQIAAGDPLRHLLFKALHFPEF